jgi:YD repeat-containing protein
VTCWTRIGLDVLLAASCVLAACGGSSAAGPSDNSTTAQATPGAGTPACRTYTTAATRSFVSSSGVTGAIGEVCSYDAANGEHGCTLDYGDSRGVSYTAVVVHKYDSVADFVDEVRVIPPIARLTTGSVAYSPSGAGLRNRSETYSYDGQRRLTQVVFRFDGGAVQTATYTAWDASGRPTNATVGGMNLLYSYDDRERILTITTLGTGAVQTHAFDANGNQIREAVASGSSVENWTWTITATERICR